MCGIVLSPCDLITFADDVVAVIPPADLFPGLEVIRIQGFPI